MKPVIYLAIMVILMTSCASNPHNPKHNPYQDEQQRAIKSLSHKDVQALRQGQGWGLARAAELNGIPGPKHLLEFAAAIPLTQQQHTIIEQQYQAMRQAAITIGGQFIEAEAELNDLFARKQVDEPTLHKQLKRIGDLRSQLRFVHLGAHLQTLKILKPEQISRYNALRGYASKDLCDQVPQGHNAAMWRQHNNCE